MDKERKDYCGPWYMPRFMRRFLSTRFNASCRLHDLDYHKKVMTRKEADDRFLAHMLRQADGKLVGIVSAYVYYAMVRMGGWFSWKNPPKD